MKSTVSQALVHSDSRGDLSQVDLQRAGATLLRVALGLIPVLGGALWVHAGNGWVFNAPNGGWEYPLFLIVISLVVAAQAGKWGHSSFPHTLSNSSPPVGK